MGKSRQLALMKGGAPGPLGTYREIRDALARFNTAPDGSKASLGLHRLHAPGFVLEIPAAADEIQQAMVTMNEEEIAWPVLQRICENLKWKMVDLETGRSFG
jgi:hypothetical protein